MLKVREVMERLHAESRLLPSYRMSGRLDPAVELGELERRIAVLRDQRAIGETDAPPKLDVDALWERWARERPNTANFDRRELLALAWDARAADDAEFVDALAAAGLLPDRPRFLRGLWHSHQQSWRLSTADQIESHVRTAIRRNSSPPRWLRFLSDDRKLVTADAPVALVKRIGSSWRAGLAALEPIGVLPNGKLGRLVLDQAQEAWLDAVKQGRGRQDIDQLIEDGVHGLLPVQATPIPRFRKCVEQLLEAAPTSGQPYKLALTRLILDDSRLGHPVRIGTRANWVGISERARRVAVQLFAARDLQAFFEVLIGSSDDYQRRRAFWERYVESAQLSDFAIASDVADRKRLRARLGDERARVAGLDGASQDRISAFLMRFKGRRDIVIVEISQPNHAMYVWDAEAFENAAGGLDGNRFRFDQLKNKTRALTSIAHSANTWHFHFAETLATLGVHPGVRR